MLPDVPGKTQAQSGKRSPNKQGKWKDEDWLREQYITKDRSQNSIANECGVNKGTIRYWRNKFGIHKGRECPLCDHQSEALGTHFKQAGHGYPDISYYRRELLTGHMMGDAWYNGSEDGYGQLGWEMKNLPFMKWLSSELGWLANEPRVRRTAEEHAAESWLRDNFGSADEENYETTYSSYTISHPWMDRLDWYEDDKKVFPDTLKLTPNMVKIWYCGDGHLSWGDNKNRPNMRITTALQYNRTEQLVEMFKDAFSIEPTIRKRERETEKVATILFNTEQTWTLIEKMGEPPDGMAYKFATKSKSLYNKLKNEEKKDKNYTLSDVHKRVSLSEAHQGKEYNR